MSSSSLLKIADGQPAPAAIDEEHLGRMTLGDPGLEREVLQIFARQTSLVLRRVTGASPEIAAAAAHTLKGSAGGIGAWRVAEAAERLEQAAGRGSDEILRAAKAELEAASLEACAAIAVRLGQDFAPDLLHR